ncbi:dTDP-4-dehydrorhamnose reductase [Mariprofundus aestuarium]|uniref:dTDP-4-dehydrorhamnose reductase n=1 Tax=Mariprofundus aestuarium TaxID=1921086 RepID=A0A2K8L5L5_MARES|nr:SDR family oxidoreductase [Mariprofundus aestuarium]ATX80274.1 dTDP-4-dehydrorhamnose reductase [Mariprofundus aestuarium]
MKKKIVVLGSRGMAGHVMTMTLREEESFEVFGVAREPGEFVDQDLDVTDFNRLGEYLADVKPQYVINCIGVLVAQSKEQVSSAILINSYLPHLLSELGSKLHYKLIHISTDCVFSGVEGKYVENAFRDGDDTYARTKALGEVINEKDLTIRTSIIGPEIKSNGTGLFDFFLKQTLGIQGYTKAFWSGVTTLELAKVVVNVINNDIHGLYQVTNGKAINKYDLLMLFKKYTKKDIPIEAVDGKVTNKTLVDTRQELDEPIPDYDVMVRDMVNFMRKHPDLYVQYSL